MPAQSFNLTNCFIAWLSYFLFFPSPQQIFVLACLIANRKSHSGILVYPLSLLFSSLFSRLSPSVFSR